MVTSVCHPALQSLVREPLSRRRQLLRENFVETEGEFVFATSLDTKDTEQIAEFEKAVETWPEVAECYLMTGSQDYLLRVLTDGESRKRPGMLTGRSSENMLVEFPGTPEFIGTFVNVKITESHSGMVSGELTD